MTYATSSHAPQLNARPAKDAVLPRRLQARSAVAVVTVLCLLLMRQVASAGETGVFQFSMKRGDLGSALTEIAKRTGIQLIFDPALVSGQRSAPLDGRYTAAEALERSLARSGLEVVPAAHNTYVLVRSAPAQGSPRIATVDRVSALQTATELPNVSVLGVGALRAAAKSSVSVTVIDREQIETSGYLTLFDLLRTQPGVQVANLPEAMTTDSSSTTIGLGASGSAAVALRRLGAQNTLILINGRRVAGYGLSRSDNTNAPDLNNVPLAIVERVEILRDGASTIYGADAVAGVINIVLRQQLDGGGIDVYRGVSSRGDTGSLRESFRWGRTSDSGTSLFLNIEHASSDPLIGDQRGWYTLNQQRHGLLDLRSRYSYPGNTYSSGSGSYTPRPGCAPENLTADGVCVLDDVKFTSLQNAKTGTSAFVRVARQISPSLELHADLRTAWIKQRQQTAPLQAGIGGTDETLFYSFNNIGPVKESTRSTLQSLTFGASGGIDGHAWDVDARIERNHVDDVVNNLILDAPSDNAPLFDFDNPEIDPPVSLRAPAAVRKGLAELESLNADRSDPVFEMPAGAALLTSGLELRHERTRYTPNAIVTSGDLLYRAPESPVSAARFAGGAFTHLDLPITSTLRTYAAARADVTQGYRAHWSPAVGFTWKISPAFTLRGSSYSGYRAPALSELHRRSGLLLGSTSGYVSLPPRLAPCSGQLDFGYGSILCQLSTTLEDNPRLRPESSRAQAIGLSWNPLDTFSIDVDVYDAKRFNEIATLPLSYAIDHPDQFPDFLHRDAAGTLVSISDILTNVGRTRTRGVDVETRWDTDAGGGTLAVNIGMNYLLSLKREVTPGSQAEQMAGYADQPRITGVASLRWRRGPWLAGFNLRYVGSYAYETYADDPDSCPDYKVELGKCRTPSFMLANVNLTYHASRNWAFSAYVNNLFDHVPRYYDELSGGYNSTFDDPVGRYYGLRATYDF